ncbi:MAG TPA: hypothetical protein VH351_13035 [Bryobacteraceae bacterium]|jgi:hypothetical protein|nr:hypothetical protein [Bryobacteraceae bacterium]
MSPSQIFAITFLVAAVISAVGLAYLIQRFFQLYSFRRNVESLPIGSFPEAVNLPDVFGPRSEYGRSAAQFIESFQRADANRVLSFFNVDRQAGPLVQHLRTSASSFRASAGLLILMALVITLLNLQGAVSRLGQTFRQLSSATHVQSGGQDDEKIVNEVQGTMGNVAMIASNAFAVSGVTVLGALLLLSGSLLVDVQARKGLRGFLSWAHGTYAARVIETGSRGSVDQKADFSDAITNFKSLIDSFAEVTGELSVLGEFRTELSEAVRTISTAVDRLPATIQSNMSSLSTQVTREIAEDLRNQYELLKRLLMAYADLGLTVKKVEEFNERLVNQSSAASDAIQKLGTIPENTYHLASIGMSLAGLVSELNAKVTDLPSLDIKTTYNALTSLNGELDRALTNMESARQGMESRDSSIDLALKDVRRQVADLVGHQDATQRALLENVRSELSRLQQKLDGLDSSLKASYQQQMNQIHDQLKQIKNRTILDLFRGRRGTRN